MLKSQPLGPILIRTFSTTSSALSRKPPKQEYRNNFFHTRKRTADPFDRRWRWTPKSAEPYNVRGGHIEWTKMPFLHRGVQMPGYIDPKTKEFVFVKEKVPEIIVPDLTDFQLKPYVPYNVKEIKNTVFGAKDLYKKTLEVEIVETIKDKIHKV